MLCKAVVHLCAIACYLDQQTKVLFLFVFVFSKIRQTQGKEQSGVKLQEVMIAFFNYFI